MKVSEYNLALQTTHERAQQSSVRESLRVWVDRPAPPRASPPSQQVTLSGAARQKQAGEAAATTDSAQESSNDPNLRVLILMIERLTGQKVRIFNASELKAPPPADMPASAPSGNAPAAPARAGFGVAYDRVENYSESEQTTFEASGIIRTSDGKEISFSLNLLMQRQYSETSSTSLRIGDAVRKTDPLLINFGGTAAQLSEQRFAFDLNSDGTDEQINAPLAGSGFLALDMNGDGKINNGSELFGPATGNGFSELAQYDGDGNGWIDESDDVYRQLKVWMKDAAGGDQSSSLASLGVGAISLHATDTPFDIKTAGNQLLGSVRASSVYLNENGAAGSVQQIDLTV